ncbi:serine/threonine-protein kinase pkn6 [Aplysia californica]|uniref:Serine/threonine-protein kinase pkn6 n=1 Tax=Aplysia californica TaxID=6500 RepID=A0ABM0JPD5_APLCA|nr:serine/threonine-protein kinase pkn6 [Aplysia californica]XP_005098410.1 serine/threonine-protein kinase pkn6 [Aplysia californica]
MTTIRFSSHVQECGPTEDLHCWARREVVEDNLGFEPTQGIHEVHRGCPDIDAFLCAVPVLCQQPETFGLVWDKSLSPSEGRYEPGEHYCRTREESRESAHGLITFHRDGETGVKFAIKTLWSTEVFNPEEVRIGLLSKHPNICCVYGIVVRCRQVHLLLEHAGVPVMNERNWLATCSERKLLAAQQCFQALEFLAANNLVHCDVKPDNLTVVREGEQFMMKLVDFGSCQQKGTFLPQHTHTTVEYWSPEVWKAVDQKSQVLCDPAMDVYAMALTLYFFETSHHLTQRIQDLKGVMLTMPGMVKMIALPDSLPADLRVMMSSCLEESPSERLTAEKACKRLQDASIPACFLQAASKPENYQDSFQLLVQKLSQRSPSVGKPSFLASVEKLKESFASALSPLSPGTHVPQPVLSVTSMVQTVPDVHPQTNRGKAAGAAGYKHFRRNGRPVPKVKSSFKPPLKTKGLKQTSKATVCKPKDSELLVSLNKAPSAVEPMCNDVIESEYPISNYLKNLAMKVHVMQNPEPACSSNPPEAGSKNCLKPLEDQRIAVSTDSPARAPLSSAVASSGDPVWPLSGSSGVKVHSSSRSVFSAKQKANVSSRSENEQRELAMEMADDDMGFVIEVLDDKAITGEEDDIADWLYQNLPDTEKCDSNTNTNRCLQQQSLNANESSVSSSRGSGRTYVGLSDQASDHSTLTQGMQIVNSSAVVRDVQEQTVDKHSQGMPSDSSAAQLPDFSQI